MKHVNSKSGVERKQESLSHQLQERLFKALYSRALIYNTCWEDPAVDRQALQLGSNDRLLVITSAGCNALDYCLAGAKEVHSVDANPRQNALLELKIAAIRALDFDDFFQLFGQGRHARARALYTHQLRSQLPGYAQAFWDKRIHWFEGESFYYRGLSGVVAKGLRRYVSLQPKLNGLVQELLSVTNLSEQRTLYQQASSLLWRKGLMWLLSKQFLLNLLGVPQSQRQEVVRQHPGGVAEFIRSCIDYVFTELPFASNYFWSLYLRGSYTRSCCPEYLTYAGFTSLQQGLVDRLHVSTNTVTDYLQHSHVEFSRFVLLDHMDWMACHDPIALRDEWQAIFERAAPRARVLMRSAHAFPDYLHDIRVKPRGTNIAQPLMETLHIHKQWAERLSKGDRVHTYGGFHIMDLPRAVRSA